MGAKLNGTCNYHNLILTYFKGLIFEILKTLLPFRKLGFLNGNRIIKSMLLSMSPVFRRPPRKSIDISGKNKIVVLALLSQITHEF